MLYGDTLDDTRSVFFEAWQKYQDKKPLEPQEQRIITVALSHPEYHNVLNDPEHTMDREYFAELGETNPFLHMALHLTILDQISIDQPRGIRKLFTQAAEALGNEHSAEHCMANSLIIELDNMLKNKKEFNEKAYIKRIKKTMGRGSW